MGVLVNGCVGGWVDGWLFGWVHMDTVFLKS